MFSQAFGAAIGTRFDQAWGARDAEVVVYASGTDAAARQAAAGSLMNEFVQQFSSLLRDAVDISDAAIDYPVQSQVTDMIRVIDEQRSRSAQVAADDHTAAAATYPIGDVIADAAVTKLPAKFSS